MHLDDIPRKTDRAREALLQRNALPRNQRLFLIMVDGCKSLRDLSEAAAQLGINGVALASMVNAGLVQWQRRDVVSEPGASPISETVGRTAAATEHQAPTPLPSLAATKFYAIDLVALMLSGQDHALREAARQIVDADGLRRWIVDAESQILERAGIDRAALFLAKVGAMLPADFLDSKTLHKVIS